jgi:hypothetical protein
MSFQLYHLQSARMALVQEADVADGEAFYRGAPLVLNGTGEFEEVDGGEYPYEGPIDAIALARYNQDRTEMYDGAPSFDLTGGLGMNPGRMQGIVVVQGDRKLWFSAEYVGTLPTVVGGSYGIVRGADERWRVDFDETTAVVVRLESLAWTQDPINKQRVVVSFLAESGV